MRSPRSLGRQFAMAVMVATFCAAVLPGATASAAPTGGIAQLAPTQGAVLVGTAYAGQLATTGATGPVSFAQTTGVASVTVSSSGAVSAAASLTAGTYTASGTDTDGSGDAGTWQFALNVLVPAPAGFTGTVENVYQSEFATASALGQASSMQSIASYNAQVAQLNQQQLASFYAATQQNPEWYQIPALMQTVAADLGSSGGAAAIRNATSKFQSTRLQAPVSGATGSALRAATSSSATTFVPQDCGAPIPDAAVFALQIVVDVAQGVYNVTLALAVAFASALDTQIGLGVAATVAAVVLGVAQIIHDVLVFEQTLANDCASNNISGYLQNIDNTTVQTYSLLSTMADAITQLQVTENATQQEVSNVSNQLTVLQTTFVQTIATDTQTLQTTIGSDTQSVTTQLQTNITGLNQSLSTILSDENTLSQQVTNNVNNSTTVVQGSVSTALTKILTEVDTQAQSLTNKMSSDTQSILNTMQSNFSTQQAQHNADLTLQIERALATWGSNVPQVQFMLPASQGGFLNSTPVGVASVVTNDIAIMKTDGAKLTTSATANYNAAMAALAKGQWLTAYADFALSYQAFA